ncbi:hypothetical protein [Mycolicibacterium diernhoferi]|uniref:Transmembrane protein n=1 Tax=Mycolicibacterium diernhoferi TaxID=1801 RepID=A0A1Q4HK88_9MYCO|nr:hypothetical protein [Mycolicibacterium diernhoferi]OJZ67872.1 hypothetical protein BRW64_05700 [Mycolicibacterium diernhoferi]OPE54657.1 hypothetical protein BV510_09125 [Mycolicibacterium diernhoferi]PEG51704.1 hypothetical protein CRI78_25375 [Mycolicibacterium diernhoferi]QYL25592.1 hypothetical protein K0O62_14840 [Mycolicibacterium diernhoferi]
MFHLRSRDQSIEATLKQIEHRVLEELHLPLWARRVAWTASVVLIMTGITAWVVGAGLPLAASALGTGAAISSVVALRRRRFRWCVAAAYLAGLSTVAGVGAFWWSRTSSAGPVLAISTGASVVAAAALTAVWVSVAITPVNDSHPDMRKPSKRRWGVRESGDTITWPPPSAGPRRPDRK